MQPFEWKSQNENPTGVNADAIVGMAMPVLQQTYGNLGLFLSHKILLCRVVAGGTIEDIAAVR